MKFTFLEKRNEYLPIVFRNLVNPTSFLILILSIVLIAISQAADAIFLLSTFSLNIIIGIVQEIRAKMALEKLTILQTVRVRRYTDQGIKIIDINKIIPGEFIQIFAGDQIAVDGIITQGDYQTDGFQVDESLLTGESKPVDKYEGDVVRAGSMAIAGKAVVKVLAAGKHTQIAQVTDRLKWYEQKLTPLQQNLYNLIRWFTYISLFVGAIIFLKQRGANIPLVDIINTIVAGALSLVPEGLVLASSVLFSYGALMMAYRNVLVQRISAIEGFGRLNYLCMDKTGTITNAIPELELVIPLRDRYLHQINVGLSALVKAESVPNSTLTAISQNYPERNEVKIEETIPFNSFRKYSGARYHIKNSDNEIEHNAVLLGAPEVFNQMFGLDKGLTDEISAYQNRGYRVLILGEYKSLNPVIGENNQELIRDDEGNINLESKRLYLPIALVLLSNKLREGAIDTLFYLQAQGVKLRVISGDSPNTVQFIAKKAGIREYKSIITGDRLAKMTDREWSEIVPHTTLFARVLPEQKEKIIRILKRHGFTGMVGDGVNDALAIKEADFGVAMASGCEAARRVADIVLLDNDFKSFPSGMRIASRIILGLEMITCLFMNKIVLSSILIIGGMILGAYYPFQPKHLLLINLFTIGLPSFLWSIFPPELSRRQSSKKFFQRTLRFAIPNGIISGIAIMAGFVLARWEAFWNGFGMFRLDFIVDLKNSPRMVATIIAITLGVWAFRLIPLSLGAIQTRLQRDIQYAYILLLPVIMLWLFRIPALKNYFNIVTLSLLQWSALVVVVFFAIRAQTAIVKIRKRVNLSI